ELGEQGPGERGRERVGARVDRAGAQGRPDEVLDEGLARVDHVGAGRPGGHGTLRRAGAERAAADVDGQGDDLGLVALLKPGDRDGGVEATRIGENDLLQRWLRRSWAAHEGVRAEEPRAHVAA